MKKYIWETQLSPEQIMDEIEQVFKSTCLIPSSNDYLTKGFKKISGRKFHVVNLYGPQPNGLLRQLSGRIETDSSKNRVIGFTYMRPLYLVFYSFLAIIFLLLGCLFVSDIHVSSEYLLGSVSGFASASLFFSLLFYHARSEREQVLAIVNKALGCRYKTKWFWEK